MLHEEDVPLTQFLCWIRPAVALGIILGCAEFFLISFIEMAYIHDTMSEGTYLFLLDKTGILGLPGMYLPQLFGYVPYYWSSHITGGDFWFYFLSYFFANIIGWIVIVASLRSLWKRVRKQNDDVVHE